MNGAYSLQAWRSIKDNKGMIIVRSSKANHSIQEAILNMNTLRWHVCKLPVGFKFSAVVCFL